MINDHTVYVEGVLQSLFEYSIVNDRIFFNEAPPVMSKITVISGVGQDIKHIAHVGDGFTRVFQTPHQNEFDTLITDLRNYQDHPSVKDMIERLQVVLALVKQDA